MPSRNGVDITRFSISVDENTLRLLESMVPLGIHGHSRAGVAVSIIKKWLWENQEKLSSLGISLAPPREGTQEKGEKDKIHLVRRGRDITQANPQNK